MKHNIYTYKNITILNKTHLTSNILHRLINICRPKQIMNTPFNLLVIYQENYRKTLKKLGLEKSHKLKLAYPIAGCYAPNYEKINKLWVYRPIIIVTFKRKFYPWVFHVPSEDGYIQHDVDTIYEYIISVMAHEFMHIVLNKHPLINKHLLKYYYNVDLYDKHCESICDRYAISKIMEWRRDNISYLRKENRILFFTRLKSWLSDMGERMMG